MQIELRLSFIILFRVTRGRYNPILSSSHRVVEQQLFIQGFLPEFLETSGDQENLNLNALTTPVPQRLHDERAQINIKN